MEIEKGFSFLRQVLWNQYTLRDPAADTLLAESQTDCVHCCGLFLLCSHWSEILVIWEFAFVKFNFSNHTSVKKIYHVYVYMYTFKRNLGT